MYTLLDTCLDRLDIFEFLSHVEDGLKDHYDIKVCTAVTSPLMSNPNGMTPYNFSVDAKEIIG